MFCVTTYLYLLEIIFSVLHKLSQLLISDEFIDDGLKADQSAISGADAHEPRQGHEHVADDKV